jgi:hypothetical protein
VARLPIAVAQTGECVPLRPYTRKITVDEITVVITELMAKRTIFLP